MKFSNIKQLVPVPDALTPLILFNGNQEYVDAYSIGWCVFYSLEKDGWVSACAVPQDASDLWLDPTVYFVPTRYCPHCGARMTVKKWKGEDFPLVYSCDYCEG